MMGLHFLRDRRRQKLRETSIPEAWEEIVDRNVPHSRLLDDGEFDALLRGAQVLVAEKRFEGCNGLELTDEIRVTIAAWGALLLLGRETDYYPELHTILVYPTPFTVHVRRSLAPGAELDEDEVRLGESWGEGGPGTLILAWDEVLKAAGEWSDGVNVAVHEFTHQLDQEDGGMDGTPALGDPALRERWVRVFQDEFARVERDWEQFERQGAKSRPSEPAGQEPLLDPYALTSAAEFFAVTMEAFFEWPIELEAEHPELYSVLREWLGQDPAQRWKLSGHEG